MPFKKGQSGNPGGKAKSKYRQMLEKALAADTKQHKHNLLAHAVKTARTDSTVLNAILKKILPDLKSVEAKLDTESPFKLILEFAPKGTGDKVTSSAKALPIKLDKPRETGGNADTGYKTLAKNSRPGLKTDKPKHNSPRDSGSDS